MLVWVECVSRGLGPDEQTTRTGRPVSPEGPEKKVLRDADVSVYKLPRVVYNYNIIKLLNGSGRR